MNGVDVGCVDFFIESNENIFWFWIVGIDMYDMRCCWYGSIVSMCEKFEEFCVVVNLQCVVYVYIDIVGYGIEVLVIFLCQFIGF